MKDSVSRIVTLLEEAGFRLRDRLDVLSVPFDFEASLTTPERFDLVVVADTATEDETHVEQRVLNLSRALDVSRSQRPLTTILIGPPKPKPSTIEAISRVSRVLFVDDASASVSDDEIRQQLAILLPIPISRRDPRLADSMKALSDEIIDIADASTVAVLVNASVSGEKAVESEFCRLVSEDLKALEEEE